MEESKNQILQPRKLNLDVPPLSTRRPSASSKLQMLSKSVTNNMVPFSWERIPGEPKDKPTSESSDQPPPPKPPPAQSGGDGNSPNGEYGNERFSNGIDIFSLGESGDDTETNWNATSGERDEPSCNGSSFIIQRFLPDAQALAEASVMNKDCLFPDSPSFTRAVSIGRSQHALKGCGLGSFLPWRMKPKPCSVKSPVCDTIIGPGPNVKQKRV